MEFLIVHAQDRVSGEIINNIPVMINGELNGLSGDILKLDPGAMEVSIDYMWSETKDIQLENTTFDKPMTVVIDVGEPTYMPLDPVTGGPNA